MNEFDYEVKQKKDLARSAAHRVCGSKSTKCDLPSDHLTEAQKRALSGPVESYNLGGPMKWAEFKRLPDDLKKQYLTNLRDTYRASDDMLGMMFGVTGQAVYKLRSALGVKRLDPHQRRSHETEREWAAFIHNGPAPTETAAEEPKPESLDLSGVSSWEDLANAITSTSITAPDLKVAEPIPPLRTYTAEFRDVRNWEELYALLKSFPEPGEGSYIRIRVERK